MIFLSHNYKDKPVIERFDQSLISVFGRDNVFYDSWNIQPGDGIIDKMEDGLQECKYFLFFVSANSLASPMVKLEWQNALMRSAKNESMKFIPIRVDRSDMPVLLTQAVWIDLYRQGLDVAVRQVIDVCSGKNLYNPSKDEFSNLRATVSGKGGVCDIEILAEHFMEPISSFAFFFSNEHDDQSFTMPDEAAFKANQMSGAQLPNGVAANLQTLALDRAITPGHSFKVQVQIKPGKNFEILRIMHERTKNNWFPIKVESKQASPPLVFGELFKGRQSFETKSCDDLLGQVLSDNVKQIVKKSGKTTDGFDYGRTS